MQATICMPMITLLRNHEQVVQAWQAEIGLTCSLRDSFESAALCHLKRPLLRCFPGPVNFVASETARPWSISDASQFHFVVVVYSSRWCNM